MIAKLRRPVALLLVLLTLFSLVPFGFAVDFPTIQSESGVDPPTGETAPIEEGAATEPPAETTEPLADASTEVPTEAAAEEATQPPAEGRCFLSPRSWRNPGVPGRLAKYSTPI